ncbi:MAG: protein kinase [Anaerolineae bacterium]|nr:protein kinase [Anaerolineae bacterium]
MTDLSGQRLGQYELISLLGKGGMAAVYLARQSSVKRDVAIKVIKPDLLKMGEFIDRFRREAQTIANLKHPYILKVFDFGDQGDAVYLVMELQTGGSLADLIRRNPLSLEETARLLDQLASALDHAHRQGIVHRDLKPQNVLLDNERNVILSDFGIAKILNEPGGLTASGMVMGTPTYMAPEQWQGKPIDAKVDVYALGVMLYETLTGQVPFEAETPFALMHKHIHEMPAPISTIRADVPISVERVIAKAMAKDPSQRYQSAGEVASTFRQALIQHSSGLEQAEDEQQWQTSPLPKRRSGRGVVLGIAIVAVFVIVGVILLSSRTASAPSDSVISTSTSAAVAQIEPTTDVTATASITFTPSATATQTSIPATVTATNTPEPSSTPVPPTAIPTVDAVAAAMATNAIEATINAARTDIYNQGQTLTSTLWTATPTATYTPSITTTYTPSVTYTPSSTRTPRPTRTHTSTPTITPTLDPVFSYGFDNQIYDGWFDTSIFAHFQAPSECIFFQTDGALLYANKQTSDGLNCGLSIIYRKPLYPFSELGIYQARIRLSSSDHNGLIIGHNLNIQADSNDAWSAQCGLSASRTYGVRAFAHVNNFAYNPIRRMVTTPL